MGWLMKLFSSTVVFLVFVSNFAFAFSDRQHEARYLMSYPPCPQLEDNMCPMDTTLCQMDLSEYIEFMKISHEYDTRVSPIRSYELDAITVITSADSIGKRPYDIVRTDCGAHGLFHFQPPEGILEWAPWDVDDVIENAGDCPYYNQEWVEAVDHMLHIFPYGPGYQLLEWRDRVSAAVYYARQAGWPRDRLSWALAIANSTGVGGFRRILREDPEETLNLYTEQRPDSNHRRRRAEALRRL